MIKPYHSHSSEGPMFFLLIFLGLVTGAAITWSIMMFQFSDDGMLEYCLAQQNRSDHCNYLIWKYENRCKDKEND